MISPSIRYVSIILLFFAALLPGAPALAQTAKDARLISVPLNRSALVTTASPMSEVIVANPEVADIHAHNPTTLTVVGKRLGQTNVRLFDRDGGVLREFDVMVTHDLPAIRRALKNFLPDEAIGVDMVNTGVALTGNITGPAAAEKALKIVHEFIQQSGSESQPEVLNLMQTISGQQVMLRVRVGEVDREALNRLGVDLNAMRSGGDSGQSAGVFVLPQNSWPGAGGAGGDVAGTLKGLEKDGLFKLLAEPNLVAVSGEEAEFLAGGEIPIPVAQGGGASGNVTVQYKPVGVAVKFTPLVLSENRIRIAVQPEVSEVSPDNNVTANGFNIPSISTRRARTTVELAPGESFMIAGLIKDEMRAVMDINPSSKSSGVLGTLLQSSKFQRRETELVIAVTPYLVDPLKGADVKLPTDTYQLTPMEKFFLHSMGLRQSSGVEGPVGFMAD